MIQFDRVQKQYPGSGLALQDVSFTLEQGQMAFLTGHSGAGKSTLLKLIALIERPTRGQVIFDGRNVSKLSKRHVPYLRRQIGVIFQDHRLLEDQRVFDNVALPLVIAGVGYGEIKKRVRAALDKVDLLHKERAYPPMLSGGEQQRVGIARAIIGQPRVLLADEPTGNLDPELSEQLMQFFINLNELGVTILVASHDAELIQRLHKPVWVLQEGNLVHCASSVPAEPESFGAQRFKQDP